MKTLGLVGGIAPASTIEYYRMLFAAYQARVPDGVQAQSRVPLISIIETAYAAARRLGLTRVGLLGTRFTMQGTPYPRVFTRGGIAVVVPDAPDMDYVHDRYMGELVKAVFLSETRAGILAVVDRLRARHGIDGVILGGTEPIES